MSLFFWPYKQGSNGCRELSQAINARRLRLQNSNFRPSPRHTVINWGNSCQTPFDSSRLRRLVNKPHIINITSDKLLFFKYMRDAALGEMLPDFMSTAHDARVLLSNTEGKKIYCRTKLRGHSGDGIVIATRPEEVVPAQLYTLGLGWRQEWRVHVAFGRVIDYQKKCKMSPEKLRERGLTEANTDVRNIHGGWVYAREGRELPSNAADISLVLMNTLGLDFGAVDVCILKNGDVRVLEINSACGLEGSTIDSYARAFRRELL